MSKELIVSIDGVLETYVPKAEHATRYLERIAELEAQLGKAERELLETKKTDDEPIKVGDTVFCVKPYFMCPAGTYVVDSIEGVIAKLIGDPNGHYLWRFRNVRVSPSEKPAEAKPAFEPLQFVTHTPTGRQVRIDELQEGTAIVSEPFGSYPGEPRLMNGGFRKVRVRIVDLAA